MSGGASWRDRIEIHPAAELFPMLSEAELDELAADIAANGLRQGVVLWTPDPRSKGRRNHKQLFLLDGRNRLEALERAIGDPIERDALLTEALDPEGPH